MNQKGKPSIVFFLPSFEGGGAERNVINILKGIDKKNYNITLILGKKKGFFLEQVPKDILVLDFKGESLFNIFFKLAFYFYREKPDIFVSTFPRFTFANISAKIFSRSKVKFVIVEQTTPSSLHVTARNFFHKIIAYFFLPSLLKFFYPMANMIICVSHGVKKDLLNFAGNLDRIEVIYNPVIKDEIYQLAGETVDHPWFLNKEIPVVISVGRLMPVKDYQTLLRAFALVLKKKNARLVILGDGQERKNLENLSRNINIAENVNFLGFQENPYKYLIRSSVFINSSIREGFSNAIIEAMACGVPVISTKCAGPEEIIENGKNGFLVPIGDEEKISERIINILENTSLANKLSAEGRKRASFFTVQASIQEYEKVFNKLIYG